MHINLVWRWAVFEFVVAAVIIVEAYCYYGHQSLQIPLVILIYYWRLVSVVMEHGAEAFSNVLINTIDLDVGGVAFTIVSVPPPGVTLPQPHFPFPDFGRYPPMFSLSLALRHFPLKI